MKHKIEGSSSIIQVEYDPIKKTLKVWWAAGGSGTYSNISSTQYTLLMNSESKGQFIHQNFKSAPKKHSYSGDGTQAVVKQRSESRKVENKESIEEISSKFHDMVKFPG